MIAGLESLVRCKSDPAIKRVVIEDVQFPLGVYPIEPMTPKQGYAVLFEAADGDGDEEGWEEWPDRYLYDIVISAERLEPLCRALLSLLPGRVYPILDVMGHDAYREIDPYVAYELVGLDRYTDALRRFRDFFFEDGMCGFGAMSEEPFIYLLVDEHKIVSMRVQPDMRERLERVLHAFDLEAVAEPAGADAASHEHQGVLVAPEDRPELLTAEEIVEHLRDEWRLTLNIEAERNVDDEGNELGLTEWRAVVRIQPADEPSGRGGGQRADQGSGEGGIPGAVPGAGAVPGVGASAGGGPAMEHYAEVLLIAPNLLVAEELVRDAAMELALESSGEFGDMVVVALDRVDPEQFRALLGGERDGGKLGGAGKATSAPRSDDDGRSEVLRKRWLT